MQATLKGAGVAAGMKAGKQQGQLTGAEAGGMGHEKQRYPQAPPFTPGADHPILILPSFYSGNNPVWIQEKPAPPPAEGCRCS